MSASRCTCVEGNFLPGRSYHVTTNVDGCAVHGGWQVERVPPDPNGYDVPTMLRAFEQWWNTHGARWKRLEQSRRRDYLDTFAAGYAAGRNEVTR
jgi:hypothetical protein